jgi:hypothetical protein
MCPFLAQVSTGSGLLTCEAYLQTQKKYFLFFIIFFKYSINIDTHTRMSIHSYEHIYAYLTSMSNSKRLSQLDLKIYEVGH